jgi:hypothetical protein
MTRGITTTAHLRARSTIDPYDRNPYDPCWHWTGAKATDGTPRIWTFDHERGDKRCMSGPKAVWNISRGAAPIGKLVYRKCVVCDCVNPGHLVLAASRTEIGANVAKVGSRKGTSVEQRRANVRKAWAARGITVTPTEIVLACRAAPKETSNIELAREHNICHTTVSQIRLGLSHKTIQP